MKMVKVKDFWSFQTKVMNIFCEVMVNMNQGTEE